VRVCDHAAACRLSTAAQHHSDGRSLTRARRAARAVLTMSVIRSVIPMRSSTAEAFARPESGDLSYVTVLAPKADPDPLSPDALAQGVIALHNSLRRVASMHPLLCVCVGVANTTRARLAQRGIQVREFAPIEGGRWSGSFMRLQVLKLLEYRRLVYLDVDTIVLKNIDHLFMAMAAVPVATAHLRRRRREQT
jgi:hypothetical protein